MISIEGIAMRVLDPTARADDIEVKRLVRDNMSSSRVAVLTNKWPSWDVLSSMLARDLDVRYGVESTELFEIPISSGADDDLLDTIGANNELAIVGLAN
jgi:hypothetical protein